ncbi:uncharacterized protein LOC141854892 [Brevipalpus obovatus]|uniref:uncharacterized protein LOC141854892 n=1 Tax=Brevipalpus obovatus TaxID=246614 RepID=UPI003D9E2550
MLCHHFKESIILTVTFLLVLSHGATITPGIHDSGSTAHSNWDHVNGIDEIHGAYEGHPPESHPSGGSPPSHNHGPSPPRPSHPGGHPRGGPPPPPPPPPAPASSEHRPGHHPPAPPSRLPPPPPPPSPLHHRPGHGIAPVDRLPSGHEDHSGSGFSGNSMNTSLDCRCYIATSGDNFTRTSLPGSVDRQLLGQRCDNIARFTCRQQCVQMANNISYNPDTRLVDTNVTVPANNRSDGLSPLPQYVCELYRRQRQDSQVAVIISSIVSCSEAGNDFQLNSERIDSTSLTPGQMMCELSSSGQGSGQISGLPSTTISIVPSTTIAG